MTTLSLSDSPTIARPLARRRLHMYADVGMETLHGLMHLHVPLVQVNLCIHCASNFSTATQHGRTDSFNFITSTTGGSSSGSCLMLAPHGRTDSFNFITSTLGGSSSGSCLMLAPL